MPELRPCQDRHVWWRLPPPHAKEIPDGYWRKFAFTDVSTPSLLLKNLPSEPRRPISLPSVVEGYLRELKETMNTDVERARALLAKLIGPVMLRREGPVLSLKFRETWKRCWN